MWCSRRFSQPPPTPPPRPTIFLSWWLQKAMDIRKREVHGQGQPHHHAYGAHVGHGGHRGGGRGRGGHMGALVSAAAAEAEAEADADDEIGAGGWDGSQGGGSRGSGSEGEGSRGDGAGGEGSPAGRPQQHGATGIAGDPWASQQSVWDGDGDRSAGNGSAVHTAPPSRPVRPQRQHAALAAVAWLGSRAMSAGTPHQTSPTVSATPVPPPAASIDEQLAAAATSAAAAVAAPSVTGMVTRNAHLRRGPVQPETAAQRRPAAVVGVKRKRSPGEGEDSGDVSLAEPPHSRGYVPSPWGYGDYHGNAAYWQTSMAGSAGGGGGGGGAIAGGDGGGAGGGVAVPAAPWQYAAPGAPLWMSVPAMSYLATGMPMYPSNTGLVPLAAPPAAIAVPSSPSHSAGLPHAAHFGNGTGPLELASAGMPQPSGDGGAVPAAVAAGIGGDAPVPSPATAPVDNHTVRTGSGDSPRDGVDNSPRAAPVVSDDAAQSAAALDLLGDPAILESNATTTATSAAPPAPAPAAVSRPPPPPNASHHPVLQAAGQPQVPMGMPVWGPGSSPYSLAGGPPSSAPPLLYMPHAGLPYPYSTGPYPHPYAGGSMVPAPPHPYMQMQMHMVPVGWYGHAMFAPGIPAAPFGAAHLPPSPSTDVGGRPNNATVSPSLAPATAPPPPVMPIPGTGM